MIKKQTNQVHKVEACAFSSHQQKLSVSCWVLWEGSWFLLCARQLNPSAGQQQQQQREHWELSTEIHRLADFTNARSEGDSECSSH